jgi:hypothetical protein
VSERASERVSVRECVYGVGGCACMCTPVRMCLSMCDACARVCSCACVFLACVCVLLCVFARVVLCLTVRARITFCGGGGCGGAAFAGDGRACQGCCFVFAPGAAVHTRWGAKEGVPGECGTGNEAG